MISHCQPPRLWIFNQPDASSIIPSFVQPATNSSIGYPNAAKLVQYAHATLVSPALSTLKQALSLGYV
jgi:hypothetical protein